MRAAEALHPIGPNRQNDRHFRAAIIASPYRQCSGSGEQRDRQKSARITRRIHLPLLLGRCEAPSHFGPRVRSFPRMSIDLAPVCLPFVFGFCRPCPEHIGRPVRVAPAFCPSSCGSMLRTMAELFKASHSLASGIRRGCRAHTHALRHVVCEAYRTVVVPLITPCRPPYRSDPHGFDRRLEAGARTHFWPA